MISSYESNFIYLGTYWTRTLISSYFISKERSIKTLVIIGFKREILVTPEQAQYLEILFNIRTWLWNKLHEVMQNDPGRGSEFKCYRKLREIEIPDYFEEFHNRLFNGVAFSYSEAWNGYFDKIKEPPTFHENPKWNKASVTFTSLALNNPGLFCKTHKELAFKNLIFAEPLPENVLEYKSICFSRHNGKYFISGTVRVPDIQKQSRDGQIGLDMGIKTFATDNTGREYKIPKRIFRIEARIRKLQRALSKKQKGSKNRQQVRTKLEKAYTRKSNIGKDFCEKLSTQLLESNKLIALEDLDFAEWKKGQGKHGNNKLAASQTGYFVQRLEQKQQFYPNTKVIKIDKWYKSTQICSSCGSVQPMKLSDRTYICPHCGMQLDRDHNAAINILNEALRTLSV